MEQLGRVQIVVAQHSNLANVFELTGLHQDLDILEVLFEDVKFFPHGFPRDAPLGPPLSSGSRSVAARASRIVDLRPFWHVKHLSYALF